MPNPRFIDGHVVPLMLGFMSLYTYFTGLKAGAIRLFIGPRRVYPWQNPGIKTELSFQLLQFMIV